MWYNKKNIIGFNSRANNVSSGGVGRNIAHNLALLNVPVSLLSAVGNDGEGIRILEEAENGEGRKKDRNRFMAPYRDEVVDVTGAGDAPSSWFSLRNL